MVSVRRDSCEDIRRSGLRRRASIRANVGFVEIEVGVGTSRVKISACVGSAVEARQSATVMRALAVAEPPGPLAVIV